MCSFLSGNKLTTAMPLEARRNLIFAMSFVEVLRESFKHVPRLLSWRQLVQKVSASELCGFASDQVTPEKQLRRQGLPIDPLLGLIKAGPRLFPG